MTGENAAKDVQVSVGKDLSMATIQGVKVEVSPKSNVVVYTNDGVQTKPATAGTGWTASGDAEIRIGKDFNTVAMYGAKIDLAADGSVIVYTNGTVKVKPGPANDTAVKAKAAPEIGPEIGDEMEDGTILAGYCEGKPLYATPKDAPGTYTFNEAAKYAARHALRVPTKGELNVLWENRDKGKLKGTFNETGSHPAGWYWSSSQVNFYDAWGQRFSDGNQDFDYRGYHSSLRCVR